MTRLPRTFLVLAMTLAVVLGTPGAASAAYTATATTPRLSVSTASVTAPGGVVAQRQFCTLGRFQLITLSWTASSTARVGGYRVTVYRADGSIFFTTPVSAATTTVTGAVDTRATDPTALRFSVTTVTDYGWTSESAPTAALPC